MLQLIQEKLQGWLAGTIIAIICLTFALWGIHSYLYGNSAQNAIAKVNGVKITQRQFSMVYNQIKRQQQLRLGANYSLTSQSEKLMKQAALQSIITSLVLNKAAHKDGFRVAPVLVEAMLLKMPIFQVNGVFSRQLFEQYAHQLLYSVDDFLAQLRNTILVNQIKSGITETSFVLPHEVKQTIQLINQKRSFNYFLIPTQRFSAKISPSAQEIEKFYQQNISDFKLPEKVSIQFLHLSVADLSKKIQPTASQLQQYYTDNIAAYTKPKQWKLTYLLIPVPTHATKQQLKAAEVKLKQVVNKIKQHTDFAKLITAYSDNIDSVGKLKQGNWVVAAQLPANLRTSLLNLKKSGDITTPIRIEQGYILLKLLAIKQQQVIPYQSIEAKVLEAYKLQQAEQQFANLRDQLANITYEYPNSLQPAAKKLSLSIQSTGLFTKNGEQKGIISNPKVVVAAFSDNVLQQHNNSDLIDLNDNSVVVLRVKSHISASVKPVKEVKPFIIKQLQHKTAAKQANQLGTEIIQAIKHGQSLQQVAQKHQLELQVANNIARHDARINPAILSAVFRIAPPTKSEDTIIDGLILPSGDYVVIALFKVSAGEKQKLTTAQLQIFQETAANNLGSLEYQLYVNGLMQKAKIKKFISLPAS